LPATSLPPGKNTGFLGRLDLYAHIVWDGFEFKTLKSYINQSFESKGNIQPGPQKFPTGYSPHGDNGLSAASIFSQYARFLPSFAKNILE
jgi:hypothetical protein